MNYEVLLQRYAEEGDEEAFQALYKRFNSELHGFLFESCPVPNSEINDILQDVWTTVIRKAHLYDPTKSARNWLYRISERVALNTQRVKDAQKRGGYDICTFNISDEDIRHYVENKRTGQSVSDPQQVLLDEEQRKQIQDSIAQLPEGERKVVNLVYLEGLTLKETAEVLGILVNILGVQLRNAKQCLKLMLGDLVQH